MADGVEYHVRALLEAQGADKARRQMGRWGSTAAAAASRVEMAGARIAGTGLATAAALGKMATGLTIAAGAYGMGRLVQGAIGLNIQMENAQYKIGATLQLFNRHSAELSDGVWKALDPAEQFKRNMDEAASAQERLFTIAAKSPATYEQTQAMFDNILPGAISLTQNMEDIFDLTNKSLAVGQILGGQYELAGSQLSRILTGGAGAEMETWRQLLQKPIAEAGATMKDEFGKPLLQAGLAGEKLTMAFNKLSGSDRLRLVQAAVEKLGVVTEALGGTWAGVTSTIESDLQLIQRRIGKTAFGILKARMAAAVGKGGVFDPTGATMDKLMNAAGFFGEELGRAADVLMAKIVEGTIYVADHWDEITDKLLRAFDLAYRAGALYIKYAAARAIVGGGMQLAGAAGSGIQTIISAISSVGAAGLMAAPALVIMAGGLVAFAGVAAFFIEHWDRLVEGFRDGTITLAPLLDIVDLFWAKLVALGASLMGTTDPAEMAQSGINGVTTLLTFFVDALGMFVRVGGWALRIMSFITNALQEFFDFWARQMQWLLETLASVAGKIPGLGDTQEALTSAAEAISGARAGFAATVDGMDRAGKAMVDGADAYDAATVGAGEGITAAIRDRLSKYAKEEEGKLEPYGPAAPYAGPGSAAYLKKPAGNTTHIHKMVVHQDLRNHDPDRVIGAFYKAIDRSVSKRTQAVTLPEGGI